MESQFTFATVPCCRWTDFEYRVQDGTQRTRFQTVYVRDFDLSPSLLGLDVAEPMLSLSYGNRHSVPFALYWMKSYTQPYSAVFGDTMAPPRWDDRTQTFQVSAMLWDRPLPVVAMCNGDATFVRAMFVHRPEPSLTLTVAGSRYKSEVDRFAQRGLVHRFRLRLPPRREPVQATVRHGALELDPDPAFAWHLNDIRSGPPLAFETRPEESRTDRQRRDAHRDHEPQDRRPGGRRSGGQEHGVRDVR